MYPGIRATLPETYLKRFCAWPAINGKDPSKSALANHALKLFSAFEEISHF